jgi:hypothetical protein
MGIVYMAEQTALRRVVALKMVLHAEHLGEEQRRRFHAEAEAVAMLQHPNIVQVHEVGEHNGVPYFSLELCAGGSLEKQLDGTPWEPQRAAELIETLAHAMQAAHRAGLVHRDLKPGNVLFTAAGTPKVTDFGLVKRLDVPGHTHSNAIVGTPSYMAPEQAGSNKTVGPPADVYALGAILYELLTGRPPFQAATAWDTIAQVVNAEPVPPGHLYSKVPRDLETICLTCLQKAPAKRFASAVALADDLRRFQAGEPITARPVGRVERAWRWCRRNALVATLLAAMLLVFAIGAAAASVLALLADRRATEALEAKAAAVQAADEARREQAKAEAARNEVQQVNDQLVTNTAQRVIEVLRAHGTVTGASPYLLDPEVDALWELAASPGDFLRAKFLKEALAGPVRIHQLRNRAPFALHATVGLDRRRRDAVERALAERLAGPNLSSQERFDLALTLAALGNLSPATARQTAVMLAESIHKGPPNEQGPVAAALFAVTRALEPKDAAAALADALANTTGPDAARALAAALLATASQVAPHDAATILSAALQQSPHWEAKLPLAHGLSTAAEQLGPEDAKVVCRPAIASLIQSINKQPGFPGGRALGQAVCSAAAPLAPKEAAAVCKPAVAPFIAEVRRWTAPDRNFSHVPPNVALGEPTQGLAAVMARLEAKDAAAACREAAELLSGAISRARSPEELAALARGLALMAAWMPAKEAAEICNPAGASLVAALSHETGIPVISDLGNALAAVAARLEPRQAKEMAAALLAAIPRATKWQTVQGLARGIPPMAARLDPQEVPALRRHNAEVFSFALGKTTDPSLVAELAWQLSGLTRRLGPEEAAAKCREAAAALLQAMTRSNDSLALRQLELTFAAVVEQLPPKEAAAKLIEALGKVGGVFGGGWAVEGCLREVATRLTPEEANEIAAALDHLIARPPRPNGLRHLASGLVSVAARLGPKAAASVCRPAVTSLAASISKPPDNPWLEGLGEPLSQLARHLGPEDAAAACRPAAIALAPAITKPANRGRVEVLARELAAVVSVLPRKEAAALCGPAAASLAASICPEANAYEAERLAFGLSTLAARLELKDASKLCRTAAGKFLSALEKTTDVNQLNLLSQGLVRITANLQGEETAAVLGRAMTNNTVSWDLRLLAEALASAQTRMDPKTAASCCQTAAAALVHAMSKDNYPQPKPLAQSLSHVLAEVGPASQQERAEGVATIVGEAASTGIRLSLLPMASLPTRPLPCRLSTPALVNLLKHPCCVGDGRRLVLDALATRYGLQFTELWDFVHFAEDQKLGLDFTSPPKRSTPGATFSHVEIIGPRDQP